MAQTAITLSPKAKKAAWALGIGGGLIGGVLLYHKLRVWWAKHQLAELAKKAANGEIPSAQFLNAVTSNAANPNAPHVTAPDAPRMSCSVVLPSPPFTGVTNGVDWDQVRLAMRSRGECL